jgi:hypothetical protein
MDWGKLRSNAVSVVSCGVIAAGLAAAGGSSAAVAAAGAGTNIGNAAVLATEATGSLGNTEQDDWWVIYPASAGGTVELEVSDTTSASAPCGDVTFTIDGPDGGNSQLAQSTLGAGSSQKVSVDEPRSGFYYVEMDTAYCGSVIQPITYSLRVLSGGGGKIPAVTVGKTGPGGSIGYVHSALVGATVYSGTVATSRDEYWYQLYKPSSAGSGTVRFADTTVYGSAPCSDVDVTLTDADGNTLDSNVLGDDTAVSYPVTDAGLYYLEVSAAYCSGSDGATYSIEPNPPTAFSAAPPFKVGKIEAGDSMKDAAGPLADDTVYSGTVATSSDQYWYKLYEPSSAGSGTVRFADTTIAAGSAPCSDVDVTLTDPDGNILGNNVLGDDTAVSYPVTDAGLYYLEVSAAYCSGSDGATYSIEPNPPSILEEAPAITKISSAKGRRSATPSHGERAPGLSSIEARRQLSGATGSLAG